MESRKTKALNETILDIGEAFWRILEQWKAIVITAVCITILFLTLMHIRSTMIQQNTEKKDQDATEQELLEALPDDEQVMIAGVYRLWQEREHLGEYIHSSPLMAIDPNHVTRVRTSWTTDKTEKDNMLNVAYALEIQSDECRKALANVCSDEIKADFFSDLFYITYPNETSNGVVCIDVFLTDEMQAEEIQKEILHQVKVIHERFQKEFGDHQIQKYESEIAVVSDDRLYEKQSMILSRFANTNNYLKTMKNDLTSEQKDVFEKLKNKELGIENEVQTQKARKRFPLLNTVIGFVLGVFIYVAIYLLYILISQRVLSANILTETSIRDLGEWYCVSEKKKQGILRDGFIWKKRHADYLDREKQIGVISKTIETICRYKRIEDLLFQFTADTTCIQDDFIQDISEYIISKSVSVKNVRIRKKEGTINDDIIMDTEGLVLIVIDSKTHFKDVSNILDLCHEYEKPVVGSIFLG